MKNLHILLLLSCLVLFSCTQDRNFEPPGPQPEKACHMQELKNTLYGLQYIYTLDTDGRALQCEYHGQSAEGDYINTYEYTGDKLSAIMAYNDKSKTIWLRKMTFTQEGNKIYEHVYRNHDGVPHETDKYIFTLDANGHLIAEEQFHSLFGVLTADKSFEYETDANGNITESRMYKDGKLMGATTYTYDTKKNLNLALPEYTILKTGKNNVVKQVYTDTNGQVTETQYSYMYNEEDYPISSSDGQTFSYLCK